MLYPNLSAEYEAGWYPLDGYANRARLSKALMHEVFYGEEPLEPLEQRALYQLISRLGFGCDGYTPWYLYAPRLSVLDPGKNRNRYRAAQLREKLEEASKIGFKPFYQKMYDRAESVYKSMKDGVAITYAAYRNSIADLQLMIYTNTQAPPARDLAS